MLTVGGVRADDLAREFGRPSSSTTRILRSQARAYLAAAPRRAHRLRDEGVPLTGGAAAVRRGGARRRRFDDGRAGLCAPRRLAGERLIIHGNNKEDTLLRGAADVGALVVLDSLEEVDRARALGVTRFLIRVTPGIEADTHEAIKTAHHGSKFGLPPDDAIEALRRVPEAEGLHVHVGSQLMHFGASLMTVDWVAQFAARARQELGWTPQAIDLGGGLGVRHVDEEPSFTIDEFVHGLTGELQRAFHLQQLPQPRLIFEPGRSLVSRAGVTLYSVGGVKRAAPRRRTSRSTAACPITHGLRCTTRATRRCLRIARRRSRPASTPWPASTASRATC